MKYIDILDLVKHKSFYAGQYMWESYGDASIYDFGEEYDPVASAVVANGNSDERDVREVTIATDDVIAYRWRDPKYIKSHDKEAKKRGVDNSIAFDGVKWIEVDSEREILKLLGKYVGDGIEQATVTDNTNTEQFTVKFDHRYVLEIRANSMDEARNKAEDWMNSLRRQWEPNSGIIFVDNYTVKERVEVERD